MLGLVLFLMVAIDTLLILFCVLANVDDSYDGFRVLAVANGLAAVWFGWLVLKAGVTVEVLVK